MKMGFVIRKMPAVDLSLPVRVPGQEAVQRSQTTVYGGIAH